MLSAVPEKTLTLFSCRVEDWADPNTRLMFIKKFVQVFFQTVFFLDAHCFTWAASDKKPMRHYHTWGTVDVITLPWQTFFLFALCHSRAREGYTRLRLSRGWPHSFLHLKDIYEQLKLASVDPYISWKSAPGTLQVRNCPMRAGFTQLCGAGKPAAGNSALAYAVGAPGWKGVLLFIFSHSVLCLLLCVGWWLGAFQKYKHLSLETRHPIAQYSAVLAAEPFLYSLCTGQGFFHFMHHP